MVGIEIDLRQHSILLQVSIIVHHDKLSIGAASYTMESVGFLKALVLHGAGPANIVTMTMMS